MSLLSSVAVRPSFRSFRTRLLITLASCVAMFLIVLTFAACSADNGDPVFDTPLDGSKPDAPSVDAGGNNNNKDTGTPNKDGSTDSGSPTDTGTTPPNDTGAPDTGPPDTTPPAMVTDLAATVKSHSEIDLTWTAPADNADAGTGTVAAYELRYAKTPITNVTEFLAATAATAPAPVAPGQVQNANVTNLDPNTLYHFAVRARDAANNFADISNDASATTKGRAKILITEVAVSNSGGVTDGFDFIEGIVTQAGEAEGLEFKQLSTSLYTLAKIDLAVNDIIVVHMTAPAGSAQEDVTKDKTSSTIAFASANAYDVYSATTGLTATDNLITINDGTAIMDALAFSNRDHDAATATMTAWAAAKTATAWTFANAPVDGTNDCETQRDTVNVAVSDEDLACGGFATAYAGGQSINRNGVVDTNSKNDWYLAVQSPGAAAPPPPTAAVVVAQALSATSVAITFDHEIDATSLANGFTIAGLNVAAAAATNVNVVTLTTDAQVGVSYIITIANTVKTTAGAAIVPATARFCAFTALPALVALNEVNTNISTVNGGDLVELKVTRGGSLFGYELHSNPTAVASAGNLLATLPAICGSTGDIVVVHLIAPATTATETLSVNEQLAATFTSNYDTAYDVRGGGTGVGFAGSQVLAIRNLAGAYIDAAAFSNQSTSGATYIASLQYIQGLATPLWSPANCGGVGMLCTDASTPTAIGVAANWTGSATSTTGTSTQRIDTGISAASWAVAASSWGQ